MAKVPPEEQVESVHRVDAVYNSDSMEWELQPHDPQRGVTQNDKLAIPDEHSRWVLVLRRKFRSSGTLCETTLDLKSLLIRRVIKAVVKGLAASMEFDNASLTWPHDTIFRYRDALRIEAEKRGELAIKHVAVLLELVEKDFSEKINKIKELFPMGITDFGVVRELFSKGDLVVAANSDRIYRIKSAEYRISPEGVRYLHLKCTYIDCDGKNFGTVGTELRIYSFDGVKYINALSVYPLKNHPDRDAFKSVLLTRGKKFAALRGQHFKVHNAIAASLDLLGNLESRSAVESRVMVDTATYNRYGYGYRIRISPFADNRVELTNEELMLCTDQIPVFSLQDKHFFTAAVDNIQDIVFNDKVFDQLVLPEAQKQMVRVLVENHAKGAAAFDDFVKGKGKGLIAVLHGPPGVGKTMTAEAVAEHTRRPLYVVTSGELGHDAKTMEDGLKRVLDLSRIFDAVLLLDEADVFLEARSTHDLKRNALVSVFLRMLEYYQGIMFLTTNRIASFDDAFHSRIHISLQYRELDTAARHQVWKNFGAAMEANITDEEYRKLAAYEVNGRRVKNIWRTAQALAADKDEKVGMRHLEDALAAMGAMN